MNNYGNYGENDIHKFKSATSSFINKSEFTEINRQKEIMNSREMILKVFSNIDKKKFEEKDNIENAWKKITTSIKSTASNEDIGSKLFYHSSIIDLKNEILLIETDHPGFIQLFRIHEKYILTGLKRFVPELNIKTLSFRLKGSNAVLADRKREEEKKSVNEVQKKLAEQDKALQNFYGNSYGKSAVKDKIPENLNSAFERMKKNLK